MNGAKRCDGLGRGWLGGTLILGVVLALPVPALAVTDADRLRQEIQTRKLEQQRLEHRLEVMERRIARLAREARELEEGNRILHRRIERVRQQLVAARERHRRHLERLARTIRIRFMMGGGGELRTWLSPSDPTMVGRVRVYLDYLARQRAARVAAVRREADELAALQRRLSEALAEQEQRLEALKTRRRALEEARSERRRVLAMLRRRTQADEARLARLQADRKRLQGWVESLDRARQSGGSTPIRRWRRASLHWPVKGKVVARYGAPRAAGGRIRWEGWLIEAPEGTPVRAVDGGVVRRAGWMRGYGNLIIVDHGRQRLSVYAFNQTLLKKEGERVAAGEVIALVGNSGGRERSALYFELRQKGRPLDPAHWLARR